MLLIYLKIYLKLQGLFEHIKVNKEFNNFQKNKLKLLASGDSGYMVRINELGLEHDGFELLKKAQKNLKKVVIAEIDQDGFLLSHFGPLKYSATTSKKKFLKRLRFNLKLVTVNGFVGVEKCYAGNKRSFVNEIKALYHLGNAGCNVPAIMDVDFDKLTLTLTYILGDVIREKLAKENAIVRDRDVDKHPAFMGLNQEEKHFKRIQEGRRVLDKVIDLQFVEKLSEELKKIHSCHIILKDIKYGNIIIEKQSGNPYFIDFEDADHYPRLHKNAFKILCGRNMRELSFYFNTENLI